MSESAPQLDDLGVFVRVVDAKSMSGAARRLGVPKSTVSRAIARLEDGLRVRLFQRTTRSLAPTDAGQALYAEVLPHVEALRSATSVLSSENETPRGVLRITAPNDIGTLLLGDLVTRFTQRYPEVTVEVVLTSATLDLVAEGIDLALRGGVLRDSSLVAKKIAEAEMQLYAAPSYLAARGTPKTVSELAEHDCVLFRGKNGRARWALECKGTKGGVDVHGNVSADDFAFVLAATLAGGGIALLPRFIADSDVRAGKLVRVLAQHAARSTGGLYAVHASAKHVPRKVAAFRDFLIETLRATPL